YRSQAKSLLALSAVLFGEIFGSGLSIGTLASSADGLPASGQKAAKHSNDFNVHMANPFEKRSQRAPDGAAVGQMGSIRTGMVIERVPACKGRPASWSAWLKRGSCRVALGGHPPRAPTDPDVPN